MNWKTIYREAVIGTQPSHIEGAGQGRGCTASLHLTISGHCTEDDDENGHNLQLD